MDDELQRSGFRPVPCSEQWGADASHYSERAIDPLGPGNFAQAGDRSSAIGCRGAMVGIIRSSCCRC